MNKQIVELKPEQIGNVVGGVAMAMVATYSTSATMVSQQAATAQSLDVRNATVLRR
jgi:hypothetical protein